MCITLIVSISEFKKGSRISTANSTTPTYSPTPTPTPIMKLNHVEFFSYVLNPISIHTYNPIFTN